jgi:protein-tyrosine kinase
MTGPTHPSALSRVQNAGRSIGAILVDSGRLSAQDAEQILRLQSQEGLRFGEAGLRLGLITETDILYALSLQFNHPYLHPGPRLALSEQLVAAYRPFSHEGEQIRTLRSQLQMRWFDEQRNNRSLAVISPDRGEGRSYVAANLAIAFSQVGERTLLIDADMRSPRQHRLFRLENDRGLSRLLAGRVDDRVVNFISGLPGLGVLTAGPLPPNAMELLSRHGFEDILAKSMASFDVVIIDTPAVSAGPDAQLLSRVAGGAMAVARVDQTKSGRFKKMIADMTGTGTHIVGSVLLDSPSSWQSKQRNDTESA